MKFEVGNTYMSPICIVRDVQYTFSDTVCLKSHSPFCQICTSDRELRNSSIVEAVINNDIDIIESIRLLNKKGFIATDTKEKLFGMYCTTRNQSRGQEIHSIVKYLKECVSCAQFDKIMDYVYSLCIHPMRSYETADAMPIARMFTITDDATILQDKFAFFNSVKGMLDNNEANDRLTFCVYLKNNLTERVRTAPGDSARANQMIWDRYVTVVFLHIQQCREQSCEMRVRMLKQMRETVPMTVDRTYTELMYHSKMATTYVYWNRIVEAETFLDIALELLNSCKNNFYRFIMLYNCIVVYRLLYMKTKDSKFVGKVEHMYELVLRISKDESGPELGLWGSLVFVHMAQTYLGIDIFLEHHQGEVSIARLHATRYILTHLCKGLKLSKRREMFFNLAMAKLNELEGNIECAVAYSQRALTLTEDGAYFDIDRRNIELYQTQALLHTLPSPAL